MRPCMSVILAVLLAAQAAAAGGKFRQLTAREFIALAAKREWGYYFEDSHGVEVQVHLRLAAMCYRKQAYVPRPADVPVLMEAMRNEVLDMPARLCVARFLLELDSEEARTFVAQHLDSADNACLHNAAAVLIQYVGTDVSKTWGVDQMLRTLEDDRLFRIPAGARVSEQESERRKTHVVMRDKRPVPPVPTYPAQKDLWSGALGRFCRSLGRMRCKRAVPVLINALARRPCLPEAALALGEIGDTAAVPILLETLEREEVYYRWHADEGQWKIRQGTKIIRRAQATALGRLRCKAAVPILIEYLKKDPETDLADALGDIGDDRADKPLRDYLEGERSAHARSVVRCALLKIEVDDPKELLESLLAMLTEDKGPWVVVRELERLEDPRAVDPLLHLARTSSDQYQRLRCIKALGNIGGRKAIRGLVSLFDEDYRGLPVGMGGDPVDHFHRAIGKALQIATDETFGADADAWRVWLKTLQTEFAEVSHEALVSSLKSDLQTIRSQLMLYKVQHNDRYPGRHLADQMTMWTDVDGNTQDRRTDSFRYGPYLQSIPANPISGDNSVVVVTDADVSFSPPERDGGPRGRRGDRATASGPASKRGLRRRRPSQRYPGRGVRPPLIQVMLDPVPVL